MCSNARYQLGVSTLHISHSICVAQPAPKAARGGNGVLVRFFLGMSSTSAEAAGLRVRGGTMQPDSSAGSGSFGQPADSTSQRIAQEIERLVGTRNYQHWFRAATSLKTADDVLTVGVGSPFLLSWMQKQFRAPVAAAAQAVLGPSARINFEVDAKLLAQSAALPSKGRRRKMRKQPRPASNRQRAAGAKWAAVSRRWPTLSKAPAIACR